MAEPLENSKLVFFPFHEPITGDEVKCLDGSVYVEDDDEPQLGVGAADGYGYLMQVRDGQITIRGALYDGSSGPCRAWRCGTSAACLMSGWKRTWSDSSGPHRGREGRTGLRLTRPHGEADHFARSRENALCAFLQTLERAASSVGPSAAST